MQERKNKANNNKKGKFVLKLFENKVLLIILWYLMPSLTVGKITDKCGSVKSRRQ